MSHPLELLFVADTEALFLVDDEKSEVSELDILRKEAMGPDHDVDFARREVFDDLFLLAPCFEAREHLDAHRKGRKSFSKRRLVLEREHRRRDEHGDLFAVGDGLERGAHRDFGLSVAHVAADEAVHGRR